ncbi:hypothetical protein KI387_031471, partial [Taxus chinensis]
CRDMQVPKIRRMTSSRSGGSEELKKAYTLFVYGTLKRGFGNQWLTEEMIGGGHAEFLGKGRSRGKYPLVCGPFQVPFLLFMEGKGRHVWGELYAVDSHALARFDELEGTSEGHYVRRPIQLVQVKKEGEIEGQAYFAGDGYADRLWMKTGKAKCLSCYSEEEGRTYVRRKDRPSHLTFLQHINLFVSTPPHQQPQAIAAADC